MILTNIYGTKAFGTGLSVDSPNPTPVNPAVLCCKYQIPLLNTAISALPSPSKSAGCGTSFESLQNALEQYEQLSALDPNDKKLPREIAIVYQTIGETYIAANNKTENLQKALEWIEKSHKLLLQMKAAGTLPEFD